MITNHAKGYRRDREIIDTLTAWGALDTTMLQDMFFPSLRMAQKRLYKLFVQKKVNRSRDIAERPYVYYIDKLTGQIDHRLGVNRARLWITKSLKNWEQFYHWEYEPNYGTIRPDALMGIKNMVMGKYRFLFIEYDRSNNVFDKIEKYNQWYADNKYTSAWWVEYAEKFPTIFIFTERPELIQKLVTKQNRCNLLFQIIEGV